MASTLLLSRDVWDLCADTSGNIALASPPYAIAQDAASAIRLFQGECYYDTRRGLPYFQQILGQYPSLEFMRAQIVAAALTVPGTKAAAAFFTGLVGRRLTGQVQVTDTAGKTVAAGF